MIDGGRRVYLDTNILIAFYEGAGRQRDLLEVLFEGLTPDAASVCTTSALTFSELLVRPYRDRNAALVSIYKALADRGSWLMVCPLTVDILDLAAILRSQRAGLRLPDAIHIATAMETGCSDILSGDLGIKTIPDLAHPLSGKIAHKSPTVIRPDEPTLAALIESLCA